MRKIKTLKKNYEFNNVLKSGKYFVRKHVIVYIKSNKKEENVIGIAINNKLCTAVKRNRIKRIIRECFYGIKSKIKKGNNIVFLWNKKAEIDLNCFHEVKNEIINIFEEADLFEE